VRICLITREYPGASSYFGGIGTTYARLAPELARQGHEVNVVTLTPAPLRREEVEGLTVHGLPGDAARPRYRVPAEMDRAVRRLGPVDVVLAPEWGGDAALHAFRRRRPPLVTHLHTSLRQAAAVSQGVPRPIGRQLVRNLMQHRLERLQSERSDAVLAVSSAVLAWARELWDIGAIPSAVLPNGVDVAELRRLAEGPPPAGFPGDGPVVAFAGRLEARKGVQVLGDAMTSVWRELPEARLVLIGSDTRFREDSMGDHVRRTVAGNGDRLHLLGSQPVPSVLSGLARADVVALPSYWDALPNVALESIALGRPTVYTTGIGFDDIFEDGVHGLGVPRGRPEAVAEAILRLLRDPGLRERIGGAARQRADALALPEVARRHAEFLASVTKRG
jgi:glycosyltransferase involved in cell wall biosynthesis